jgi:hypothetical protein
VGDPLTTMVLLDALWTSEPEKETELHDLKVEGHIRRFEPECREERPRPEPAIRLAERGRAVRPAPRTSGGRLRRWGQEAFGRTGARVAARLGRVTTVVP